MAFIRFADELNAVNGPDAWCEAMGTSCKGCQWSGVASRLFFELKMRTGFVSTREGTTKGSHPPPIASPQSTSTRHHFTGRAFEEVVVSDTSRALFKSNFTACANDVGLGHVDICVSSFWLTPSRLAISSFTTPHFTDEVGQAFSCRMYPATTPDTCTTLTTR